VDKKAQRRFLVAYAHQNPEFRDELVRRLEATRGIVALEHASPAALKKYLKDHPDADRSKHTVKKGPENKDEKGEGDSKGKGDKPKGAVGEKNLAGKATAEQVHGNAVVHGDAKIYGDGAQVGDHAVVYGNARIGGDAKVGQDAEVFGNATVEGNAQVSGEAKIAGKAEIIGTADVDGKARVGGSAKISGGKISGDTTIVGGTWKDTDVSHGQWKDPKGPKMVQQKNLKDEDVDAVLDKVVNKKGQMLSPAELMRKFLAEAKPETRERMKDMSPAEFMDIVNFMVDDEEAEAGMKGKTASVQSSITDEQLFTATLRVASTTKDPALRRQLAMILRDAKKAENTDDEKDAKFEEGSKPSDEEITKGMSPEEKKKWMKNKGKVQHMAADKKAAMRAKLANTVFPGVPVKVADKWIQDAIKRPGRVREYLNVPEGQDIPMGKLDSAIEKVKGTGDHSLLSALILAKRLKSMG
jgi:carbonic anhydrase/acetyltransferase-like protein (isoleucine patch superfamily)